MDCGAKELDVVGNYGRFLDGGRHNAFGISPASSRRPIRKASWSRQSLRPIAWTQAKSCKRAACASRAGVDFVKTSTGFGPGGATPEAVKTMLEAVDGRPR